MLNHNFQFKKLKSNFNFTAAVAPCRSIVHFRDKYKLSCIVSPRNPPDIWLQVRAVRGSICTETIFRLFRSDLVATTEKKCHISDHTGVLIRDIRRATTHQALHCASWPIYLLDFHQFHRVSIFLHFNFSIIGDKKVQKEKRNTKSNLHASRSHFNLRKVYLIFHSAVSFLRVCVRCNVCFPTLLVQKSIFWPP